MYVQKFIVFFICERFKHRCLNFFDRCKVDPYRTRRQKRDFKRVKTIVPTPSFENHPYFFQNRREIIYLESFCFVFFSESHMDDLEPIKTVSKKFFWQHSTGTQCSRILPGILLSKRNKLFSWNLLLRKSSVPFSVVTPAYVESRVFHLSSNTTLWWFTNLGRRLTNRKSCHMEKNHKKCLYMERSCHASMMEI